MNIVLREKTDLSVIIDPNLNCVFVRRRGKYEAGTLARAVTEAIENPSYQRGMHLLIDLREIDHAEARFAQLMPQAETWRAIGLNVTPCKMAVVHSTDLNFGVGRQSSAIQAVEGIDRRPFREMSEALEFLGLPPDTPLPFDDD